MAADLRQSAGIVDLSQRMRLHSLKFVCDWSLERWSFPAISLIIDLLAHSASTRPLCLRVLTITFWTCFNKVRDSAGDIFYTNPHHWGELDTLLTGPQFITLQEVMLAFHFDLTRYPLHTEELGRQPGNNSEYLFSTSFPAL